MRRDNLTLDPQAVGAAFHERLTRLVCAELHQGQGCAACRLRMAPAAKPFARLLLGAAGEAATLTHLRYVPAIDGRKLPLLTVDRTALAQQAVGAVLEL